VHACGWFSHSGFIEPLLALSLSTSQFIELPPLLLFYRRLAGRPSRITQERDALARECFDPAQHLLSLLFAIELETTPKERKYSATLSFVFALSRLAIRICNLGECSLYLFVKRQRFVDLERL
jgi:hypothetical protein